MTQKPSSNFKILALTFFSDELSLWNQASNSGQLTYSLSQERPAWYKLSVYDGDSIFVRAKIEVVDKFRIRVYMFKHHEILDVADEYHRTKGFGTFNSLLDSIAKSPE